ncbi:hypothetical protein ACE103_30255 [Bradyrhizobium sp. ma5]
MALYQRQLTGKGTEVSSSLVANGLWAARRNLIAGCAFSFSNTAVELA